MESDDSEGDQEKPIEDVYVASSYLSSSESVDSLEAYIEPEPEPCSKMKLYMQGLYSPGSGEICAKYIAMSASSVLRHPYYDYPAVVDPGIVIALKYPEPLKIYNDDGQDLYLDLCKQMNIIPIRIFHRGLLTEEIDLRFYGVNPAGVRAMSMALARNQTVRRLDLTSNFLDHLDATYHIGQMLGHQNALTELILSGCNIGCKFLRRVVNRLSTRVMDLLDLSGNKIKDEGFPSLTEQIFRGAVIKRLNLRRNDLTSDSLALLAEVLEFHNHTTHLDISWNKFYKTQGAIQLIRILRQSEVLVELNLSFTSLCVGVEIGALLRIKTLEVLDLSNNRLTTRAAKIIAKNLVLAKSLRILDLSFNPFIPQDALEILLSLKNEEIDKLEELRMDFIEVNKEFAQELKEIRELEFRKNTLITHGHVLRNYTLQSYDMKVIYLKQLVTLTSRKKKQQPDGFDILVYILDESKKRQTLEIPELQRIMKKAGAPIEDDFIIGISKSFPGPKTEAKLRPLNLDMLADYIHRIYPDKQPTPTPLETPPEPVKKKKKGGKKKKQ
ncbi:hypothetical protein PYW08_014999 [Mythimna loreyi]|uniref:Uncharacterized protein n=1 Tax=Mythimna loreyi TaxID=667449 RepID=A0ACC2R3F6_9NEOP|nr:hypothetical protein PYW08_014999 [Mythimna loreyi]